MVDQFHVDVHVEPCRRLAEEAVGVGCDVPFTQGSDELWLEAGWVERRQVNACEYVSARRVCAICGESKMRESYRRGLEHV